MYISFAVFVSHGPLLGKLVWKSKKAVKLKGFVLIELNQPQQKLHRENRPGCGDFNCVVFSFCYLFITFQSITINLCLAERAVDLNRRHKIYIIYLQSDLHLIHFRLAQKGRQTFQ